MREVKWRNQECKAVLLIQVTNVINSESLTCQHWLASWEWEGHSSDSSKIYSLPRIETCSFPVEICSRHYVILTEPHTIYAFTQKKVICNILDILLAVAYTRRLVFCVLREYSEWSVFNRFIVTIWNFILFNYFMYINYVKRNLRMTS